jgi:catechol 2,3-dioxygenase-like lactoylglutathione lyase family enzyme
MPLYRLFAVFLIALVPAFAQPQGPRGVAFGHIHLNSANPDAANVFWTEVIGASAFSRGSVNGASMIGGLILISKSDTPGPSAGSVLDRVTIRVPDLEPFLARLAKTSYKSARPAGAEGRLVIDGPDGVKVELEEDNSMFAPLESGPIRMLSAKPVEMQAWYARVFAARHNPDDNANVSRTAGATLIFDHADAAAPTAGRAIDHIAFEIRDLEAFCAKLAADGIKLDTPYHAIPEMKMASAFLTDPWGTRIELTEGLSH